MTDRFWAARPQDSWTTVASPDLRHTMAPDPYDAYNSGDEDNRDLWEHAVLVGPIVLNGRSTDDLKEEPSSESSADANEVGSTPKPPSNETAAKAPTEQNGNGTPTRAPRRRRMQFKAAPEADAEGGDDSTQDETNAEEATDPPANDDADPETIEKDEPTPAVEAEEQPAPAVKRPPPRPAAPKKLSAESSDAEKVSPARPKPARPTQAPKPQASPKPAAPTEESTDEVPQEEAAEIDAPSEVAVAPKPVCCY